MEKFRFGITKLNYELYAQLNSLIVIGDLIAILVGLPAAAATNRFKAVSQILRNNTSTFHVENSNCVIVREIKTIRWVASSYLGVHNAKLFVLLQYAKYGIQWVIPMLKLKTEHTIAEGCKSRRKNLLDGRIRPGHHHVG